MPRGSSLKSRGLKERIANRARRENILLPKEGFPERINRREQSCAEEAEKKKRKKAAWQEGGSNKRMQWSAASKSDVTISLQHAAPTDAKR
jgi:hypothetical protein